MESLLKERKLKLFIAVDGLSERESLRIAEETSDVAAGFKHHTLIDELGAQRVLSLFGRFGPVFTDMKIRDTPQATYNRVRRYVDAGASYVTVDPPSDKTLRFALNAAAGSATQIIVVSELTSETGDHSLAYVRHRAQMAVSEGADGMTCPGSVLQYIRKDADPSINSLFCVTPGIRPLWAQFADDDQRDSITPAGAVRFARGHDLMIVVGRAIIQAHQFGRSPKEAAWDISREMTKTAAEF